MSYEVTVVELEGVCWAQGCWWELLGKLYTNCHLIFFFFFLCKVIRSQKPGVVVYSFSLLLSHSGTGCVCTVLSETSQRRSFAFTSAWMGSQWDQRLGGNCLAKLHAEGQGRRALSLPRRRSWPRPTLKSHILKQHASETKEWASCEHWGWASEVERQTRAPAPGWAAAGPRVVRAGQPFLFGNSWAAQAV